MINKEDISLFIMFISAGIAGYLAFRYINKLISLIIGG